MEPAGVPALLAYREGEKFAGLVPLVDEIPDDADVSDETLEVVMRRYVELCLISCGVFGNADSRGQTPDSTMMKVRLANISSFL
jgi:hypothetical protein